MRRSARLPRHHQVIPALWCGALLCLALSILLGTGGLLHLWRIHREHEALTRYAFVLTRATDRLRSQIERLHEDDNYLEALAREQLGLVRDGDLVYRFPPSESDPPEP